MRKRVWILARYNEGDDNQKLLRIIRDRVPHPVDGVPFDQWIGGIATSADDLPWHRLPHIVNIVLTGEPTRQLVRTHHKSDEEWIAEIQEAIDDIGVVRALIPSDDITDWEPAAEAPVG